MSGVPAIDPVDVAGSVPLLCGRLSTFAFLLDVDGTLVDIAPTPGEVVAPRALRQTLDCLRDRSGGALALVSGRPIAELDRIFAPLRLPAVGGHGAEFRPVVDKPAVIEASAALDAGLRTRLTAIARLDPGIIVEDKGYALALHYRLVPGRQWAVEDAVSAICANLPLGRIEILPGKAVVEIKSAGFDKGSAVRRLMALTPFAGRRPVFVGDDTTDETAYAVLPEFGGIGLSVGRAFPGAAGHFAAPRDVRAWLARLSGIDGMETP